jgi:Dehydrogenases (flavoproteins)
MYDMAIIGGGPAGATLARLVSKDYSVLLLEKRAFSEKCIQSAEEKCCGGLIDPDAQQMLAKFRLGIPKSVLLSPQMFAVRAIDMQNSVERFYQRHYINIDRGMFDKWMVSIIPDSVKISLGSLFKSYEVCNDHVLINYTVDGKEYQEKAKLLVGADGAFSKVRRQGFSSKPIPDLYISIQEWFEVRDNQNFYGAVFDNEITDFYSWTIPKENQLILGTALKPGAHVLEKFELLKRKLERYDYDFGKSIRKNGAYLYRPVKLGQINTGNERIAFIGEAAGFISPSSAEGLSYAFKGALALSRALENGFDGFEKLYRKNLASLYRNIAIKNLKSPAMYNALLRCAIMKSGLLSLNIEN